MKLFLTSGANPIGRAILRRIQNREPHYDAYALASSVEEAAVIEKYGGTAILSEPNELHSIRAALAGSDLLIHNAEKHDSDLVNWRQIELINVSTTRKILHLALELNIPKVVYLSSTAIYGDTKKNAVDERYEPQPPQISHYHRTKYLAHYDIVKPLMAQGAPIIAVLPGSMYGIDSNYLIDHLMVSFHQHAFPVNLLVGPKTMFSIVHIDDAAEGVLLAAEKGELGAEYILSGPAVTLNELVRFWSRITGRRETILPISPEIVQFVSSSVQPLAEQPFAHRYLNAELVGILGTTNIVSSSKSKHALGWKPRSLQNGMLETFEHIAALSSQDRDAQSRSVISLSIVRMVVAAILFVAVWQLLRNRNKGENL